MKKHSDKHLNQVSQVHSDASGFLSSLRIQIDQTSFRRNVLLWGIGAIGYALIFHLIYSISNGKGLYPAAALACITFILLQIPAWQRNKDSWLAGSKLGRTEALWLEIIRLFLTLGGAFAATYYLIDRLEMSAIAASYLIALALFFGHLTVSFVTYPVLLYIIFGLLTTVVSIVSFNGMNYLLYGTVTGGGSEFGWFVPKLVSWVLAVLFAYLTNRKLVFQASGNFWHEMLKFFVARLASGLLVEFLGLFILENLLSIARDVSNLLISLIVVVVNYVFSKLFVFKRRAQ